MKDVCLIKYIFTLIKPSLNRVDFDKVTTLFMEEKLKKSLDNRGVGGMLLTDLSKAFDCHRHDLLMATQVAYGFDQ